MLQPVLANNMLEDSDDRKVEIKYGDGDGAADLLTDTGINNTNAEQIKTGSMYKVTCEYSSTGANKGLVCTIRITDAT